MALNRVGESTLRRCARARNVAQHTRLRYLLASSKNSLTPSPAPLSIGESFSSPGDEVEEVVDEAGYLRVGIRVRPLGAGRGEQSNDLVVNTEKGTIEHKDNKYRFAHVFRDDDDNGAIMDKVGKPIVGAVTSGYNGTLFAYGQTGSGKTYTMGEGAKMGTEHEGVGHRMIRALYQKIARDRSHAYQVEISFLQVYVEKIYDLLAEKQMQNGRPVEEVLALREDKTEGVFVVGARKQMVKTAEECLSLCRAGMSRLNFASTQMNKNSSRSHGVCQIFVTRQRKPSGAVSSSPRRSSVPSPNFTALRKQSVKCIEEAVRSSAKAATVVKGKMSLVDLAGSEDVGRSGATGMTLAEAKKINTSLLALGNVIAALTEGKTDHVPFRNSVLTRLLQVSIGGNCKTSLLCCCSPAENDLTETLSTLGLERARDWSATTPR